VGKREIGSDGISDIHHVTAQGIIAGANMVLIDFHPTPEKALCDGPQALGLADLPHLVEDVRLVRETYERRREAALRRLEAAK
jgi:3-deoxy-7-phosphoheptulonate synthase